MSLIDFAQRVSGPFQFLAKVLCKTPFEIRKQHLQESVNLGLEHVPT